MDVAEQVVRIRSKGVGELGLRALLSVGTGTVDSASDVEVVASVEVACEAAAARTGARTDACLAVGIEAEQDELAARLAVGQEAGARRTAEDTAVSFHGQKFDVLVGQLQVKHG